MTRRYATAVLVSSRVALTPPRVKLAKPAAKRATTYPLAASLDFKSTDPIDGAQPLRTALLLGIADALGLR